jgi:hypothetical protein
LQGTDLGTYSKPDVVYLIECIRNGIPKYWVYSTQKHARAQITRLIKEINSYGGEIRCRYIQVEEMRSFDYREGY